MLDLGRGGFGCGEGGAAMMLRFWQWRRRGLSEEDKLSDSEVVYKVKEMRCSGMIIGEIFAFSCDENCLYCLPPFPPPPCVVESPRNRGSRQIVRPSL